MDITLPYPRNKHILLQRVRPVFVLYPFSLWTVLHRAAMCNCFVCSDKLLLFLHAITYAALQAVNTHILFIKSQHEKPQIRLEKAAEMYKAREGEIYSFYQFN